MGAFIIAVLVFLGTVWASFAIGAYEGMADAPVYTNEPLYMFVAGSLLSILIAASHLLPPGST